MKNYFLLLATSALVILFSSCQKEPSQDTLPITSLKIKTYTEDFNSVTLGHTVATYNLSYDANDRITSMVDVADPGDKFVFTYPSSSKFSMELINDNAFDLHVDYFLNSQSLIDSSFQYNNTNDTSTEKYVYNAAKQLTRLYEYDYSRVTGSSLWNMTDYTYDGSGNLIKDEDIDHWITTYEYYTDKRYVMPQVIPFQTSKDKVSLVKKAVLTIPGVTSIIANFTYTFDSKDRISTSKEEGSNGYTIIKTYTYFD